LPQDYEKDFENQAYRDEGDGDKGLDLAIRIDCPSCESPCPAETSCPAAGGEGHRPVAEGESASRVGTEKGPGPPPKLSLARGSA